MEIPRSPQRLAPVTFVLAPIAAKTCDLKLSVTFPFSVKISSRVLLVVISVNVSAPILGMVSPSPSTHAKAARQIE